jgi:hypothetical protein
VKTATVYVDYQQRASEYAVGDLALPLGMDEAAAGRVVAVYPAIGMIDVEFPHGSGRYPVESLQRVTDISAKPPHAINDTIPGGNISVSVPGGPNTSDRLVSPSRVASAFVKKALYWGSQNRRYRATQDELDSGEYLCPRCKEQTLRPAIYKRQDGKSTKLLGCGNCLFLIKRCDIIGDAEYSDDEAGGSV